MFSGAITALITPFHDYGTIDEPAYQAFIQWQIEQGIHGLVPCGTTGESPTLTHAEHNRVIDLCMEVAKNTVPVIAGTGSNSTQEAVAFTSHAKKAGADAALIVTPYYNKPNQYGLYHHFKTIHDAVDIPIVIYNIPGRSAIDLHDTTLAQLAELPNIIGIKDATGDLARISKARTLITRKDFAFLSGEDLTALAFNAQGGTGCISVTANIAPNQVAKVQEYWQQGDSKAALALHDHLTPLHQALFCAPNPIPVKYAASLLGRSSAQLRLPLTALQQEEKDHVYQAMKHLTLLSEHDKT